MTVIKESGMISLLEVDDEEEDDDEEDDDEHGGFGLGSSFFSGIISQSSDGCVVGEGAPLVLIILQTSLRILFLPPTVRSSS
jgi:hypothetical protein